ncbi:MAG TPA: tRNA uridine-5-carboxymethylaminomethyl(34) synthesis GTPase MnmE [Casimicrobiaceae bacterium]|nr:tRNA uridine-5-carboxymethylaminomethyl(34) synthesis GTPase MnmE [Casimicrobiaceae bacterium]
MSEPIAAIATPAGRGGIGIVRVSGLNLDAIIDGIVGKPLEPREATFGVFRDATGALIDQGLAILFAAPASYTGETVLELHAHGSPVALRMLVARCVELGARLAEPGEFTRRAFLNGKLDLAQAESVADLIEAATATAARAAVRSLAGEFSREVHAIVAELTTLRMLTEASLDFPEEDIEFVRAADAAGRLETLGRRLESVLTRAKTGVRLSEGLTVVLIGRPNVGKSSLLNRLAHEDAAIVTPIAGTTRDTVERPVELAGIPLTVVDTAGLRESDDAVERIGIERTRAAIERADVALVLVDARDREGVLDTDDAAILSRLPSGLRTIVVHNKIDLAGFAARVDARDRQTHVWLSALTGDGMPLLERAVLTLADADPAGENTFIARERHLVALREAQRHVAEAGVHLAEQSPPLELFAEALREAQRALSQVTGEFTADDLLGVIFARFCIGK